MRKTYQRDIMKLADKMLHTLVNDGFFIEQDINDSEPARLIICDFLTEKFIEGKLIEGKAVEASEDEMMKLFKIIIAECTLQSLKKKGILNSIEDENNEEVFFLTAKGKIFGEKLTEKK